MSASRPPRRQIPVAEQLARTAELDRIRCQRKLTEAEQAEADNLAERAYIRAWRAVQAEAERKLLPHQRIPACRGGAISIAHNPNSRPGEERSHAA